MVACPICNRPVEGRNINAHIDSGCASFILENDIKPITATATQTSNDSKSSDNISSFFKKPKSFTDSGRATDFDVDSSTPPDGPSASQPLFKASLSGPANGSKRKYEPGPVSTDGQPLPLVEKRVKSNQTPLQTVAPLAERMRPQSLDDVCGQSLVGPAGVLRGLVEAQKLPSMILWGGPGTGKTTIARLLAKRTGSRFHEINSTSSGVAECKKLFAEAKNELSLTGRKTIIFCDEIHRFSKSQQDIFLAPVEAGIVTLIAATTENPSFKVINALLSRCRTYTLTKLSLDDVCTILKRAADLERKDHGFDLPLIDAPFLEYLATFADGDARTALNLLEIAVSLSQQPDMTLEELKRSLTHTLVYDRAGDQHYDTISAFHKSIRGSDADAALYYLARMLASGEDALYIARRLIVIASEDVGLADNSMLSLATATYTAAEKVGLPEARINLGHCTVALALAKKSTRAYRALGAAMHAVSEPGIAGEPVPVHLRNAPTKLMKELGYGAHYKYNPDYVDGRVLQEYLPEKIRGKRFLDEYDLGKKIDPDLST